MLKLVHFLIHVTLSLLLHCSFNQWDTGDTLILYLESRDSRTYGNARLPNRFLRHNICYPRITLIGLHQDMRKLFEAVNSFTPISPYVSPRDKSHTTHR